MSFWQARCTLQIAASRIDNATCCFLMGIKLHPFQWPMAAGSVKSVNSESVTAILQTLWINLPTSTTAPIDNCLDACSMQQKHGPEVSRDHDSGLTGGFLLMQPCFTDISASWMKRSVSPTRSTASHVPRSLPSDKLAKLTPEAMEMLKLHDEMRVRHHSVHEIASPCS